MKLSSSHYTSNRFWRAHPSLEEFRGERALAEGKSVLEVVERTAELALNARCWQRAARSNQRSTEGPWSMCPPNVECVQNLTNVETGIPLLLRFPV